MTVQVHFYSYFKELTGCASVPLDVALGSTVDDLLKVVFGRFPRLAGMHGAMLIAVGVDYQGRSYVLTEGDEVSLFPPVQGG